MFVACQSPPPGLPPEREPDYYVYHDVLGHIHRPDARREMALPEHPSGHIVMATEHRGFRADAPIAVPRPPDTLRVLLVGDSHIDGVVDNRDNVAALLSARWTARVQERGGTATVEVVNGGTGYWGPIEYRHAMAVWRDLEPQACIVVVFDGNDFLDVLAVDERAGRLALARRPGHFERLEALTDSVGQLVSQQLNQDFVFAFDPLAAKMAVEKSVDALLQARESCAAIGAPLFVALLPSPATIHPLSPEAEAELSHDLAPEDRLSGRHLVPALTAALEAAGVPVLDLWPDLYSASRPPFAPADGAGPPRLFWALDQHLSVAGHRVVADAIDREWGDQLLTPVLASPEGY